MAKVSVIIPAYNATATLTRTIESLFAQSFTDWEAVVINDASTDGTLAMAQALAERDGRVRVINLEKNGGQSAARNEGFNSAKGEWLAILDADDAYTPERLETMVDFAEAGALDMVADNQLFYDAHMGQVSRTALPLTKPVTWTIDAHLRHERTGSANFKWGLLKPLIRRTFLKATGVEYRVHCRMGEDSLLYAELLMRGAKAQIMPEAMYVYTTATGELSRKASGFSTSRYKLEDRLEMYRYFRDNYKLTPELLGLVAKGERAAITFEETSRFKQDLKRCKVVSAAKRVVKYPGIAVLLWRSVCKIVKFKFKKLYSPTQKKAQ